MFDGRIMCIGYEIFGGTVLRYPLMCAGRALAEFPFKAKQILEKVVAPLRRGRGPDAFETAGDRVCAESALVGARPAQALCRYTGTFGFRPDVHRRVSRPVSLAKR